MEYPEFSDAEILARRFDKNQVSLERPYAFHVERERNASGEVVSVATLFLTNRECPFRCLMCDLWKNTLDQTVPAGAIPSQIRFGLARTPERESVREIKLYNSGNFFDRKAIPVQDYVEIANLVRGFDRVIVENHPALCGDDCLKFRDLIAPAKLEIALGLETIHSEVLATLNKKMNLEDFERACHFLYCEAIQTRAFLLLKPPFLDENDGVDWALRSLDYAFNLGVGCCCIIPTRTGNGMLELLEKQGRFSPPTGASLEAVLEQGLARSRERVFIDLWDAKQFFHCECCVEERINRLEQMNLTQHQLPEINCGDCR